MSRLALVEDLLEGALAFLRSDLAGYVETGCNLLHSDLSPVPGSCCPDVLPEIERRLKLVREIEAAIGRFEQHPEPQWLDDLIDGKWSLT